MFNRRRPKQQEQKSQQTNTPVQYNLIPYSNTTAPPLRAPVNGGNTCYLDSLLVAMFAENDGWDGLLNTSIPSATSLTIIEKLISIANDLRTSNIVSSESLNSFRDSLIRFGDWYSGRGQHDAAELFALLLDLLHAPFVPLVKNINHKAIPDIDNDHIPFTERMLWLNLYSTTTTTKYNILKDMVDEYFFGEKITGLRRNKYHYNNHHQSSSSYNSKNNKNDYNNISDSTVDATVSRCLIPAYTPLRETGESTSVSREIFNYVTIPFAVSRFSVDGRTKDTRPVIVSTALPATSYISSFSNGLEHTFILKSVICHLGSTIQSGHYVAYTYSPKVGWRRWDDLDDGPIISERGNTDTGEPVIKKWRDEIRKNCYLLFYELVPGESMLQEEEAYEVNNNFHQNIENDFNDLNIQDPSVSSDARLARRMQLEEEEAALAASSSSSGYRNISNAINKNLYVLPGGGGSAIGSVSSNDKSNLSVDSSDLSKFMHQAPSYTWTVEEKREQEQQTYQQANHHHNHSRRRHRHPHHSNRDEDFDYEWKKVSRLSECGRGNKPKEMVRRSSLSGEVCWTNSERQSRRKSSHRLSKSKSKSRGRECERCDCDCCQPERRR